jgi:hypothetical protein
MESAYKKDTFRTEENRADKRNIKTIEKPDNKSQDFGKMILPSENRAAAQKTIETASPTTKRSPLETSTGIFVKGKKKTGNNTITIAKDQNEILSNLFDNIFLKNFIIN